MKESIVNTQAGYRMIGRCTRWHSVFNGIDCANTFCTLISRVYYSSTLQIRLLMSTNNNTSYRGQHMSALFRVGPLIGRSVVYWLALRCINIIASYLRLEGDSHCGWWFKTVHIFFNGQMIRGVFVWSGVQYDEIPISGSKRCCVNVFRCSGIGLVNWSFGGQYKWTLILQTLQRKREMFSRMATIY